MQIVKVPFILPGYCIVAVDVLNLVAVNLVAASNASVYTEARLLVADRPQTPVKPGASAPGFLSRLRHLLLPAGREKSSSRLLLAVTIFLFPRRTQNPLHVVFGGEQFNHFCLCMPVR